MNDLYRPIGHALLAASLLIAAPAVAHDDHDEESVPTQVHDPAQENHADTRSLSGSSVTALTSATAAPARPLRFVVVADTQGETPGVADIVPQLMKDIELRRPAFVIFPGDLVGTGNVRTFNEWKSLTKRFGVKRYMVPGNHDLPGRPASNEDWQRIFNWLPRSQSVPNITTDEPNDTIRGVDQMDYFVDVTPQVRIIAVTTDRDLLPGEKENWPRNEILGGPPRALDWFKSVMALESTKSKDHVFVFTHHPVTCQSAHPKSNEEQGTASQWWKAVAGTHPNFEGAAATTLFAGHCHTYHAHRPDPQAGTAEIIIGTGGGANSGIRHRHVHGFLEVTIIDGDVTTTFYGDRNGEEGGWSFTDVLDTFIIASKDGLPRGELALYQFESDAPQQDSSTSPLSKHHALHLHDGAVVTEDTERGSVLSLDGSSYVDAKSISDHNLHILRDLRIQLHAKAGDPLGSDALDNVLVAFGDAHGAVKVSGDPQDQMMSDEIANYAYQLSYTAEGRLRFGWEYRDDPRVGAKAKIEAVISTVAVPDPQRWHEIEVLRDAEAMRVRFIVDGVPLGEDQSFAHLPTGGGAGSLYFGALPDMSPGKASGIATFAGVMDDVMISSESVTLTNDKTSE